MIRRRNFIALGASLAGMAALPLAKAQQPVRMRRIGVLVQTSRNDRAALIFSVFLETLREAGWIEGKNILIEWRFSEGKVDILPQLARELVDRKVELIATTSTGPTMAAKRATSITPIVFIQVADPLEAGIIAGLARPENNLTGTSTLSTDIASKLVSLLKEALPKTKRASIFWNRPNKGAALVFKKVRLACEALDIDAYDIGVSGANEITHSFDAAVDHRSAAIVVIDDPVVQGYAEVAVPIATARKLPLISVYPRYAAKGGLLAYGPDLPAMYRRGAEYVDRILHGATPADLPVEQPDKFKLVINLKTAKLLGIELSPILLARADDVIE